jgi:hypothetical protein
MPTSSEQRPDPDARLAKVKLQEAEARRGGQCADRRGTGRGCGLVASVTVAVTMNRTREPVFAGWRTFKGEYCWQH